ncbi:MAG: hypothetical protein E7258_10245 [Lachnospiraceae bacterium]|nr:hypothetical protein [Lachnospiraceae bacterium]
MKTIILIAIFIPIWILGVVAALILTSLFINLFPTKNEVPKIPCFVFFIIGAILAAIVFFTNFDWISELVTNILNELEEAK